MSNDSEGYEDPAMRRCGANFVQTGRVTRSGNGWAINDGSMTTGTGAVELGMSAGIRPAIKPVQSTDWLAPFMLGMFAGAMLFGAGMCIAAGLK